MPQFKPNPSTQTSCQWIHGYCTDLIWRETTEADGEKCQEAEVECVKERPRLDSGDKHSTTGYIAGDRKNGIIFEMKVNVKPEYW